MFASKKKKYKNKSRKIIFAVVVGISIMVGYFIAIFLHPNLVLYSDTNTSVHVGEVIDVYTESNYTGYKNRKRTIVYMELENGDVLHIPHLILKESDWNYDTLKETILNNTVEVKTSKTNADKIVSIKCDQQDILTYEDMNKIQISNRIGIGFICIIAIAFITLLKLL